MCYRPNWGSNGTIWFLMIRELKNKCTGARSAEEVALLRTNDLMSTQVNRISELTRTMDTIRADLGELDITVTMRDT